MTLDDLFFLIALFTLIMLFFGSAMILGHLLAPVVDKIGRWLDRHIAGLD